MRKSRNRIGFDCSFVVDCVGRIRGLAMFWKQEVNAKLFSYSNSHISWIITKEVGTQKWMLYGFYVNPVVEKRKESWQLLRMLKPMEQMAWLCIWDFNEILTNDEKFGDANRPFSQMERFKEALYDCELTDLGYKGSKYTWSNKREGGEFTKERLDRVLGNGNLKMTFSSCLV